jgi:hypothetical protein
MIQNSVLTSSFVAVYVLCTMTMHYRDEKSLITEQFLMDRLGPAPSVSRVAAFLEEAVSTTWRRLKEHQLLALKGAGTTRINLRSLVAFLNQGEDYELTYKRGKKAGGRQSGSQSRRGLKKQEAVKAEVV